MSATYALAYRSQDGLFELSHLDGVPWHEAPIPRRWHRCWPQTVGWDNLTKIERCACGATRYDAPRWGDHWMERNQRRRS